jgi:asparagine synthase (glutamine-hydrolysing)
MCGICGVYEYGISEPGVNDRLIDAMRDSMRHRGPDDAGSYISSDRRVGLGNRRLAIVDLSPAGRGPMPNEDASAWITYNGEIYNHEALRAELIQRGHRYRSRTDTETIVHLYEEHGLTFVNHLDGDFALGIWDDKKRRLVLARDRVGVKPLYYTAAEGRLIFASEIKSLLLHPAVSRELDEQALYHYLTFLTTPAPQTLFAGIKKLPAGCMLTCDAGGTIEVTRYWDAVPRDEDPIIAPGDEAAIAAEVRRLLLDSIEKRMMSDVPFGVFLSGGIDSTANVALMARLMSQPVRTFTVGYRDEPAYNEIEEARYVAEHYGTEHHEVMIGQQELMDFLPDMVFHQDEPIADPVCVPIYYVSRLARETGTRVIQVGEGSDELFCGYQDYARYLNLYNRGWRHLSQLPGWARRFGSQIGQSLLRVHGDGLPSLWHKVAPELLRRFAAGEELFWSGAIVFDEVHKQRLLNGGARRSGDFNGLTSYSIVREDLDRLLASRPSADQLERMIYLELKLRLPELLLMRVDKMTMATSVEARVPFLDYKLIEFASSIPARLKYKDGRTKHILRAALEGVIPERILGRPKVGFGAPISEWMLDALGSYVESALFNSPLRKRDLFDYDFVSLLLSGHRAGKANFSFLLWSLLNLTLWYERWIENAPSSVPAPCDRGPGFEQNAEVPGVPAAWDGSSRSIQL